MSKSTVIRDRINTNNRRFLHADGEESGEHSFFTCTKVIDFFKMFRAIINRFTNIFVSKISGEACSFDKIRMHPGTGWMSCSKLFRMNYWTNKLKTFFASIFEFTPIEQRL